MHYNEVNESFITLLDQDKIPFAADVTNISIQGNIYGHELRFLIDTGASIRAIQSDVKNRIPTLAWHTPLQTPIMSIKSVSGDALAVQGQINIPFTIGDHSYPFPALVIDRMAYDAILGRDFLEHYQAKIDLEKHVVTWRLFPFS